ncbi:MAG: hypothetical protein LBS73_00435 [Campylobacteraceae bacterium]|jgi:alpha-tubulin suppressor-like RCC1 family protein|nr:hypothetical protein [Campylobacteraceae bacterium]
MSFKSPSWFNKKSISVVIGLVVLLSLIFIIYSVFKGSERIIFISANHVHSLALDSEGRVWATGWNHSGQLGLGNNTDQDLFQPVIIKGLTSGAKIVSISAGWEHSLALDSEGKLWATGFNDNGQLGLGDNTDKNLFQSVTFAGLNPNAKIVSISAGGRHSLALDSEGKLWAAGANDRSQLGLGDRDGQTSFQSVTFHELNSSTKIISIATGGYHSLALDNEGNLWATGDNYYGQLGLGDNTDKNLFQSVTFAGLSPNAKIVSISAGEYHSLALDSEGKLWASGANEHGQTGLGKEIAQNSFQSVTFHNLTSGAKITSLSAGQHHSIALDSEGGVWATGWNVDGELGLGNLNEQTSFQSVTIAALSSSTKITSIATGSAHSLALDSKGKVWATGWSTYGQLGLGNNNITRHYLSFMPVAF